MIPPMHVTLNGEPAAIDATTVQALLEKLELHGARCATMINGRIVRRAERESTAIQPGDVIEVISMVGGG